MIELKVGRSSAARIVLPLQLPSCAAMSCGDRYTKRRTLSRRRHLDPGEGKLDAGAVSLGATPYTSINHQARLLSHRLESLINSAW